ncbi:hypothetical protein [Streptomyces melanogenes]|uniref:hypothetical protein n=1 Tax=Streptomyces melanogenes TaxID=67326 RepID=UPI00167C93C0|nr:hypothetical protein [Streptomyces melanogenes]GGP71875.1 hypothetical protein GCM10010278_57250 [Streptomyces melanogenes]
MSAPALHKGMGRVTVFSMFGPVFGFASLHEDGKQLAYVGPLTPGVSWEALWVMASKCNRIGASDHVRAQWIVTQATRSFIMHADLVVQLDAAEWWMTGHRRLVESLSGWCNQDVLVTGCMRVPELTDEQIALKPTFYPHYYEGNPT